MPKNLYSVDRDPRHGQLPATGILLVNLGTPESPTAEGLRPYLRQFLSDPRVIELSRPVWLTILNLFVLTTRPKKSAKLYANIWTEEGSPLLVYSRSLAEKMEARLQEEYGSPVHVSLGMTYGEPSIPRALEELRQKGCWRILFFPLYSHYSSSSTGASFDAVMKELMTWRRVPEIRTLHQFHDDPALIRALAQSIREYWDEHGEPDKLVTSYHGIPKRYFLNGDPYHCQCHKTTRLIAEELGLPKERYEVSFQSLFGREEWLKPYTEEMLEAMAHAGIRRVDVVCPGFSVDCLETIDEIGREYREVFMEAGGGEYHFIPCLNDRPEHVEALVGLAKNNLGGWAVPAGEWDASAAEAEAELTRELGESMRACPVLADAGYGDSGD
jgi:ferrochelatase